MASFGNKQVKNILKAISKVNHILNEQVTIYFISNKTLCPDCAYDSVLKESTNPFCPTCGGDGWIETRNSITIPASVEEDENTDDIEQTKIGKWEYKSITLTLDMKEINNYNIDVDKIEKIKWQEYTYTIKHKQWGTLQGNIYELTFRLDRI